MAASAPIIASAWPPPMRLRDDAASGASSTPHAESASVAARVVFVAQTGDAAGFAEMQSRQTTAPGGSGRASVVWSVRVVLANEVVRVTMTHVPDAPDREVASARKRRKAARTT
jgi:hypothetical protein